METIRSEKNIIETQVKQLARRQESNSNVSSSTASTLGSTKQVGEVTKAPSMRIKVGPGFSLNASLHTSLAQID